MIKCKDCAFFKEGTCEKLKTEKDHAKLYAVILNSQVQDSKNKLLNESLKQIAKSLLEFGKVHYNYEKEPRENLLAKEIEPLVDIDVYLKKSLIKYTEQLNLNANPDKVYSANIEYLCKFLLAKEGELIYHLGKKEMPKQTASALNRLYKEATRSIDSRRLVERLTDKFNQLGIYGTLEMNAYKSSVIGLTDKKAKTLKKVISNNHDSLYFTLQKFLDNALDPVVVKNYCDSAIRQLQSENVESYDSWEYGESSYGECHIIENVFLEVHEGFLTEVDAALISLLDVITFFSYFSLVNLAKSLQTNSEAEYHFRRLLFEKSKIEKTIRTELIDKGFLEKVVDYTKTDAKLLIARTQNSLMALHNHQKKLLNILNKSENIKKLAKKELTCLKAAPRFDINTANLLRKKTRNISV